MWAYKTNGIWRDGDRRAVWKGGNFEQHITYGSSEIEKVKLLYQGNCLTCQGFPIVKAKD